MNGLAGGPSPPEINRQEKLFNSTVNRQERGDPFRYVLLLRFAVLNLTAFSVLGAIYFHGYIGHVLAADPTGLCIVIFLVFMAGLIFCSIQIFGTSRQLNLVRDFDPSRPSLAATYFADIEDRSAESRSLISSSLRLKLSNRISVVRHFANSLVLLGLIGTVIGFIIALSGVDPQNTSDVSTIVPMVATLIEGMSIALYTTLVGAILNLWLMVNYRMLATGTVTLLTNLIRSGEDRAGS